MTLWVVDATVIIKWYVPESDYAAARGMRTADVITADEKLVRKLAETPSANHVRLLAGHTN